MAIAVMPERYINDFIETTKWLRSETYNNFYCNGRKLLIKFAFLGECVPDIVYGLYAHEDSNNPAPFMIFCVHWGQMYCMIEIPTLKNMNRLEIKEMPLYPPDVPFKVIRIEDGDYTGGDWVGRNQEVHSLLKCNTDVGESVDG